MAQFDANIYHFLSVCHCNCSSTLCYFLVIWRWRTQLWLHTLCLRTAWPCEFMHELYIADNYRPGIVFLPLTFWVYLQSESGHFPWIFPLDIFPQRVPLDTVFVPSLHAVGHFSSHHYRPPSSHHYRPPIYSNVYTIDRGRSRLVGRLVPVFKCLL